jgi:Flp pilus assembly protein CpaB
LYDRFDDRSRAILLHAQAAMAIEPATRTDGEASETVVGSEGSSSPRRNRPRAGASFLVIGLILAMGGFGLTFYLGTQLASSTPTVPVLIAAHDIQAGAGITAGDLTTKKYLSESVPKSALRSADDAAGHIARVDIAAGDPVLSSMVGSLSEGIAPVSLYPLPAGYVAVQFAVTVPSGLIVEGEFVDMVADASLSLFKPAAQGNVSRVVFQSLEVVKVSNPAQGAQQAVATVAFLMNECDLPYAAWLAANTSLAVVVLPLHQGGIPTADTTCPGLVSAHGVGATDVDARYHFTG